MTDPIRAALEKAAEAVRVSFIKDGSCLDGEACHALPCKCASDATANAIAAFLRALSMDYDNPECRSQFHAWAEAVLAAAKED
jgi:hypothetical protein